MTTTTEVWMVVQSDWDGGAMVAAFDSKEAAEHAKTELVDSNYDKWHEAEIKRVVVYGMDIEPRARHVRQTRVTDDMKLIDQGYSAKFHFPFELDEPFYDVRWSWVRLRNYQYGLLTVEGFDKTKVEELFQQLSEEFRTDEAMRKLARAKG